MTMPSSTSQSAFFELRGRSTGSNGPLIALLAFRNTMGISGGSAFSSAA